MARPVKTQPFAESAARTASGNSGAIEGFGQDTQLRCQLDVTAAAGTNPTLDVLIEDTVDGTNWYTVATFAQKTTTGREVVNVTIPFTDQLRARWTIGGTGGPTFTFAVDVYAQ